MNAMKTAPVLDYATMRELAVKASVDPRTIGKVARGEKVRGMGGQRAARVLRAAGLLPVDQVETREGT